MKSYCLCLLLSSVLLSLITGCQKKNNVHSTYPGIKATVLKKNHTLKTGKKLLFGQPLRLKYDDITHHLFIQDLARPNITEIDDSGNVVNIYGRKGRGPGEVESIDNFFITPKYLFIIDGRQFLINKYSRQDGHFISSLDYGKYLLKRKNISKNGAPPPPRIPWTDNNNKLFITLNGTILLPTQTNGLFLYREMNWEGDTLGHIGAIPKGYTTSESDDYYWSELENRKVPAQDLAKAFPVNDRTDPNDIYLVYEAISKIAKYNLSGKKIWEHEIHRTPEVDSLAIDLGKVAEHFMNRPNNRMAPIPLRTYVAGRCSPNGDVYLTTYTDPTFPGKYHLPLWVHQFNPEGKLVHRYKIVSDANLNYYPAIDFESHRIFTTAIQSNDITIYPFYNY